MSGRKQVIKNTMEYAAILTKLEAGKSQVKIGDMRQTIKLIRNLEAALIMAGRKSALLMIRREAVALAKKQKAKK